MSRTLLLGAGLIVLSIPMALAGAAVPVFGVLVASLAPNAFLIGLAAIAWSIIRQVTRHTGAAALITILITLLVGVNTRLPSIVLDAMNRGELETSLVLRGVVGTPIHVYANPSEMRGWIAPYAGVRPACRDDECFLAGGLRGPNAAHPGHYWREDVVGAVLAFGFSKAAGGEQAPRLTVSAWHERNQLFVSFELRDQSDALLSRFRGRLRQGYPLEPGDGTGSELGEGLGLLHYLLHGNSVSYWISRAALPATGPPLRTFLHAAAALTDPQTATATPVKLVILGEVLYEPDWVLKDDGSEALRWADLAFDQARHDRCAQILKPEQADASSRDRWRLFTADPTGRKKMRDTGHMLCEADALWLFEYATEPGRTIVTKFSAAGDLAYRISFDNPKAIYGFAGHIMPPTFKAHGGSLYFEWWNSNQSGHDRHIKRAMKLRLAEPQAPSS